MLLTTPGLPGHPPLHANLPLDCQTSYPQQYLYPKQRDQHRFKDFANAVDKGIDESHDLDGPVTDDMSFSTHFHSLSTLFNTAASSSFETHWSYSATKHITSLTIRLLVHEFRRLGRLIFTAQQSHHHVSRLAQTCSWVTPYLDTFACLSPQTPESHSFLDYLLSTHRILAKLRYHEERSILRAQSLQSSRGKVNAVLMGGSAKGLYP